MIDHQEFDGSSGRREFQSELFSYGGEDCRPGWFRGCDGCVRDRFTQSWCDFVAGEFKVDVKPAGGAGFVDHRTIQLARMEPQWSQQGSVLIRGR